MPAQAGDSVAEYDDAARPLPQQQVKVCVLLVGHARHHRLVRVRVRVRVRVKVKVRGKG